MITGYLRAYTISIVSFTAIVIFGIAGLMHASCPVWVPWFAFVFSLIHLYYAYKSWDRIVRW